MMTSRTYNQFLEIDEGTDSDRSGYDSEAEDASKGRSSIAKASQQSKRRRVSPARKFTRSDADYSVDESASKSKDESEVEDLATSESDTGTIGQLQPPSTSSGLNKSSLLSDRAPFSTFAPKKKKEGVLYLSRVPPHMKPSALRSILSPFGDVTNLYLTPTPPSQRSRQATSTRKSYSSGWVSFSRRSAAKNCVAALNGKTLVSAGLARGKGRKGGYYGDDVWNLRYLKGFGWDDLMEGVRREGREREEKVRMGIGREKRERNAFVEAVERGKIARGKEEKRARKREKPDHSGENPVKVSSVDQPPDGIRSFRQNRVKKRTSTEDHGNAVEKVLRKIF